MPLPASRPEIKVGKDVRIIAKQALDYGDENSRKLEQARKNYLTVRESSVR